MLRRSFYIRGNIIVCLPLFTYNQSEERSWSNENDFETVCTSTFTFSEVNLHIGKFIYKHIILGNRTSSVYHWWMHNLLHRAGKMDELSNSCGNGIGCFPCTVRNGISSI